MSIWDVWQSNKYASEFFFTFFYFPLITYILRLRIKQKRKMKSYKNIPQANKLNLIMNLFSSCRPKYIFTKLRYKFHPSTAIQKNVVSEKYCISAAINWQPTCGVTLSIPVKNIISSATKEKQRHRRILDDSFLRRLLKREIYSYKLDSYYITTNIFAEKRDSNLVQQITYYFYSQRCIKATTIISIYFIFFV